LVVSYCHIVILPECMNALKIWGYIRQSQGAYSMSNEIKTIMILTTGGTIEKVYDEFEGALQNKEPMVKVKILPKLRHPYTEFQVKEIMAKDSLYMDDRDREFILESIKYHAKHSNPIVVIHGTDTMATTANYCFETFPEVRVPVVFTGAMKPLGFDDSDAQQNVTEAIFAAQIARPGYYISFHGKLFNVPHVRKNKNRGTFEELP
jgi:L-asparaginase